MQISTVVSYHAAVLSNQACVVLEKLSVSLLFLYKTTIFHNTQSRVGCCSCVIINFFIFRLIRIDNSCKLVLLFIKHDRILDGNVLNWNYVMNLHKISNDIENECTKKCKCKHCDFDHFLSCCCKTHKLVLV